MSDSLGTFGTWRYGIEEYWLYYFSDPHSFTLRKADGYRRPRLRNDTVPRLQNDNPRLHAMALRHFQTRYIVKHLFDE